MITPNDIMNKKFEKAAFGYKPEEVEAIRNEAIRLVSDTNGSLNLDYIDSI